MVDDSQNDQPSAEAPQPGWRPKLKPLSRSGVETVLNDPSLQVVDNTSSKPVTEDLESASKDAPAEKRDDDENMFGVPMDEEEAKDIQRKYQAHGKWFATDSGTIVGPDGVNYSGATYDTPDFRAEVEARSPALEFSNLKTTGRVLQTVVVDPERLILRFCTQSPKEVIWSAERNRTRTVADWYESRVEDLGCCLREASGFLITGEEDETVQGITFKDPLEIGEDGTKMNLKVLERNLETVKIRFSREVVKIMLPQLWWFVARVEAAMSPKNLGNSSRPT